MRGRGLAILAAVCLSMLAATPSDAIPSPELVVGSLASLSQLAALLSALLGGGAALAVRGRGATPAESRWLMRVAVGLAALTVALAILNAYQWRAALDERQQRLSATLARPSQLPGEPQLDKTLKELSPAQQASHPLGMTAAEAEALVPRARELGYEIIDIREAAEVETGTFTGARAIRFPDFLAGRTDLGGRKALLICHNGNRSSETCQALHERGIDCRFIVGGLERWISEGRSAGGFHRSSVLEARAVPAYPNNDRLIDTAEMHGLIDREGAVIVDTRYPGAFALGHLPGAVNIPMRRMTTPELEAALERLPRRPVVVACYDRRSCFFGELVGLALWRKGRDFRGRYTVPWEYVPKSAPPPHVAAALAERNLGAWGRAQRWLAHTIDGLAGEWGFLTVLLGLALASRLAILPFAMKAERDQIVAARIEPRLKDLKAQLADDPARRMRAIRQLYKRHGLTPLFNLLALAALPILMLAGAALGDAARIGGHRHPLFGPLGEPDPTWLLALAAASLIGLYAEWALCRTRRQRLAAWLLLAPALAAMLGHLPAATNIYVCASALLLLLQRAIVTAKPRAAMRRWQRWMRRGSIAEGIVPLAAAAGRSDVGNKAARLGAMVEAGMRVPAGVVLTGEFLARWQSADAASRARFGRRIARRVGRGLYAVRSSGLAEDQAGASHAGVYDSITDVGRDALAAAIDRVAASFSSGRARHYGTATGDGAVIVQRMVAGRHAGVLFTRAPDAPGLCLVEAVEGAAEGLVSGRGRPMALRFGRHSLQPVGEAAAPFDLMPLLTMGRALEARFGTPQDIEWVSDGRRIWLVQSRDITADAMPTPPAVLAEWDRALLLASDVGEGHGVALARDEMCAMLPRPTPATQSLIEALHASGGSVDHACRALGIAYGVEEDATALFPTLFGRLYQNASEARRRAPRLTRLDIRRIRRQARGLEARMRGVVLPAIEQRLAIPVTARFDALGSKDLVRSVVEIAEGFVTDTHVEAEIVNIVAEVAMEAAREELLASGRDPAGWLVPSGETLEEAALSAAAGLPDSDRLAWLTRQLGHRAALDYELAAPRYSEEPDALASRVAVHLSRTASAAGAIPKPVESLPPPLAEAVETAGRLQTLKDDVKHVVLKELAVLRYALLALDRRLGLDGGIFLLSFSEIVEIEAEDAAAVRRLVTARAAERDVLARAASLPANPTLETIERLSWPGSEQSAGESGGAMVKLKGMRVAGTRRATGRTLVVDEAAAEQGRALAGFETGDIIVAPFVHPAWLGEVLRASGVVAGNGGWLSHMAIVARERDVAMVVGVDGWAAIPDKALVTLELDGSVRIEPAVAPDVATACLDGAGTPVS